MNCCRYYQCPIAKAPDVLCLWKGTRAEILKHVQKYHKDRLTEGLTKISVFIQKFLPTYIYCSVISSLGELFYQQFHVEGTDFFFVVQFVGPEETASEFKYEVTIKSPTGVEKIAITQVTQGVKVTLKDICEAGECIKLHYDVLKHFLGHENNLRFDMEISRIEETKFQMEGIMPRELECQVCADYMTAPIVMCANGHSICFKCKNLLFQCPTCRGPFLDIRNRALESLAESIKLLAINPGQLCVNAPYGCTVQLTASDLNTHKEICLYHPRKCPLSKSTPSPCDWNDAFFKLKDHIESEHKDRITSFESEKKVHMKHFNSSKICSRVLFACNEIFYQHFEVRNDVFFFVVQHVVPTMGRNKFTYALTITGNDKKRNERICIVSKAYSFKVELDEIYKSGKCPMIHFGCRVALLPSEVQAHKEICLYRPRKCPLSKFALSACDWNDAYFKMKEHIESEHKDKAQSFDVDLDQIYMAGECPMIHFNMIKNLMEGKDIFEFTIEISKDDGKNKQTKSKETQ
ncbi:hypothetical protein C0J52_08527 [Blattella germanica]|nr:hypothetical protein C0J52_08527 [Blattella germanica]